MPEEPVPEISACGRTGVCTPVGVPDPDGTDGPDDPDDTDGPDGPDGPKGPAGPEVANSDESDT
jgi:hypothetical protein